MTKNDAPCRACSERYTACHATCEKYLAWRAELDDTNSKIFQAKAKQYDADRLQYTRYTRMRDAYGNDSGGRK